VAIELRSVTKRAGAATHIYETSLALQSGEFNVLLGTTLSGKTTLMRLMAGLEKPSTGEVWYDNVNVTGLPVQKRSVAMVYQAFINYPSYSVFDNIASPLRVAGLKKAEIRNRVRSVAELLKLTPMLDRLPSELSGGQQQRTALARALVKGADLVLLDEPLANLDYKLREELRDELPKLFEDTGATVVYATSEPIEALMLGGYTAIIDRGTVVQYGATSSVYRKPESLACAKAFSDPPLNTARVSSRDKIIYLNEDVHWRLPESITNVPDGEYTIGLRPHHLLPANNGNSSNVGVKIDAEIQIAEISGSESVVRMTVEGNNWVSESPGIHAYEVGEKTHFTFDPGRCLYFDSDGRSISY